MTTLHNILNATQHTTHATDTGTKIHARLQQIVIDGDKHTGNETIIQKIITNPQITAFFTPESKTELPIAGTINNRFISRRIDRLLINNITKTIQILDYKSDISHDRFYTKYIAQIKEYAELLHKIYPDHKITGHILWTHDFSLEQII